MASSPKKEAKEAVREEIPEVTSTPTAKNSKKRLIVIATLAVLVAGAGGAWFMRKDSRPAQGEETAKPVKETKHVNKDAPPVFLALATFVVNLRALTPQAPDQFLQTDISLRLSGVETVEKIQQHMPEVRNRVLMLLSNTSSQELLTPDGKTKLAESVRAAINEIVDPGAVATVAKPAIKKEAAAGGKPDEAPTEDGAKDPDAEAQQPQSPEDYLVKSALFTSFIIQ